MMETTSVANSHRWTAIELRNLSPEERDAILSSAAELAIEAYHTDTDLTSFDAYGASDLHVTDPDTQPG